MASILYWDRDFILFLALSYPLWVCCHMMGRFSDARN